MFRFLKMTANLVLHCNHNPVCLCIKVFIGYMAFSILEAGVETLIWGKPFEHALDPIFALMFVSYFAFCLFMSRYLRSENISQ